MNQGWLIFLVCITAGIVLVASLTIEGEEALDVPIRTPTKDEVVPPGSVARDILKTSDEARIPELLAPTPFVKEATNKVIALSCTGSSDVCKLQAIYDFVRKNYVYSELSPEHRYIQPPGETLIYGSADELELALLLASMQRAAGFENEVLRGTYQIFVRTYFENDTIMIDPSCQGCKFMHSNVILTGREDIFK
jgi:hypothetical protein